MDLKEVNMRINPITMITNNIYKVNFKAKNNDDEYVYVPLIWDNENSDSVEISNSGHQYQSNNPTTPQNTSQDSTSNSGFKKFTRRAVGTVGTITLLPEGIKKVAKTIDNTVVDVKDSINNTIDSVAEIREHTRAVFHKDDSKNSETLEQFNNTGHTESLLAGETPVDEHNLDFDRLHHDPHDNPYFDEYNHDYDGGNNDLDNPDFDVEIYEG